MPWSNQNGGGPWGGGGDNQGPWGQGPKRPSSGGGGGNGNGNGGPPDFEDFFRKGQDQFKGMFPGGFGVGLIAVIVVILVAFWVMQAVYTIQPQERGVVTRLGKPLQDVTMPGLHFLLWPIESVEKVDITERKMPIGGGGRDGSGTMLTGDQNIVDLTLSIIYTVSDPKKFVFDVEAPIETLRQVSESAIREVVGRTPVDAVYRESREQIPADIRPIIQSAMDEYGAGLTINRVSFQDASPPQQVKDAFDEVQRAAQDEDRFVEEANQYANRQLGAARGNAAKIREDAAAYKDRVVNEAQGEAERFNSIYDTYVTAPEVTRKRLYIESLQDVLGKSNNVVIDDDGAGVVPYLPLGGLNTAPKTGSSSTTVNGLGTSASQSTGGSR